MEIRLETAHDLPAVRRVVSAAFGDEPVADLLDDLRTSTAWRGLSFVAESGGQVVGHVAFTRGWLDAPVGLLEVLVLSPLSVAPVAQGRGVGAELVRRTLELLRDRPEPLVFVEGSPGYYGRLGFEPGEEHGFTRPSTRIPPAAFQFVRLRSYDSAMTGALVYPDVFWAHDAVGPPPAQAPAQPSG